MTQQYILGELSVRIAGLCRDGHSPVAAAVSDLRRRVERAPSSSLVALVREAMGLADAACWESLERGDIDRFRQEALEAAALQEFAECAGLAP